MMLLLTNFAAEKKMCFLILCQIKSFHFKLAMMLLINKRLIPDFIALRSVAIKKSVATALNLIHFKFILMNISLEPLHV